MMNLQDTPLDQLGAQAAGHYKVAEKAADKAEQHYKSCGMYLKVAKLKVLKTRGLTWERFLLDHFPAAETGRKTLSRARADEIIAIADGRMEPDAPAKRQKEYREKQKTAGSKSAERSANRPEKPNENNAPRKDVNILSFDGMKEGDKIEILLRLLEAIDPDCNEFTVPMMVTRHLFRAAKEDPTVAPEVRRRSHDILQMKKTIGLLFGEIEKGLKDPLLPITPS